MDSNQDLRVLLFYKVYYSRTTLLVISKYINTFKCFLFSKFDCKIENSFTLRHCKSILSLV